MSLSLVSDEWLFHVKPRILERKTVQTVCMNLGVSSWLSQVCGHYNDVIISAMASQITCLTIVYSGADQRKQQSSASLAFVRGIHRWPVNSAHKGPVMRKMFPFDDIVMGSFKNVWYPLNPRALELSPRNTTMIRNLQRYFVWDFKWHLLNILRIRYDFCTMLRFYELLDLKAKTRILMSMLSWLLVYRVDYSRFSLCNLLSGPFIVCNLLISLAVFWKVFR